MPRPEATETLVTRLRSDPNPETEDFEVKSRRILKETSGKKKVVRHIAAISNSGGGTLLIGVENDGTIDGFSTNAEPIQDLVSIALEYTNPSVHLHFSDNFDEVEGEQVLRIDIESPDRGPVKYTGEGETEFPIRKHDSTRVMDKDDLRRYYQQQYGDVGSADDLLFRKETEYEGIEEWYQLDSSNDQMDVWGFFNRGSPEGLYSHQTTKRNLSVEEAKQFFAALQYHFRPSHRSGMFTIAQKRASWVGQGLGNFFKALNNRSERYELLTTDQAIANHHSEGALFVCNWQEGLLVINCISERATEKLDKVGVNLLSRGIPVDTRNFHEFAEKTGGRFRNAHQLEDIRGGSVEFADESLMLTPTDFWYDSEENPWIVGMVGENLFADSKELFDRAIGDTRFDSVSDFNRVYYHLSDHSYHGADSRFDYEYYLKRIEWWDMTELNLPISARNIRFVAERTRN